MFSFSSFFFSPILVLPFFIYTLFNPSFLPSFFSSFINIIYPLICRSVFPSLPSTFPLCLLPSHPSSFSPSNSSSHQHLEALSSCRLMTSPTCSFPLLKIIIGLPSLQCDSSLPLLTRFFIINILDSLDYDRHRLLSFKIKILERKKTRENAGKEKEKGKIPATIIIRGGIIYEIGNIKHIEWEAYRR